MTTHPFRNQWRSALPEPTPDDLRAVIGNLALPVAARLANTSLRSMENWLGGKARVDPASWELLLLRLGRHPTHLLLEHGPESLLGNANAPAKGRLA